jgi:dolichol-phosphate mannosyltransferase
MPELSVIVPTYCERANLEPLAQALDAALQGIDYEVVFVDDNSPDGTAEAARELAQQNPRVRVVQRLGRRGLASAVIEGFLASSARFLAVIDGDLQHDERVLTTMLRKLRDEQLDIVIGTRNAEGGSMGGFGAERIRLSHWGRRLSRWVTRMEITDPMSGYFVVTRAFFQEVQYGLSGLGFKILLDLLATSPRPVRVGEVGYTCRSRREGVSKLNIVVGLEYLELLLDKKLGRWLPVTFLVFGLVGGLGVVVNLLLTLLLMQTGQEFRPAQLAATSVVIALNYFLNNALTFRTYRLRGLRLFTGLLRFYLSCGLGLVLNLFVAESLVRSRVSLPAASLIGILFSSVWNYWVSSLFVWNIERARHRAPYNQSR